MAKFAWNEIESIFLVSIRHKERKNEFWKCWKLMQTRLHQMSFDANAFASNEIWCKRVLGGWTYMDVRWWKKSSIFKIYFHSISLEMTRNTDLNTFGIVWTPGGPFGAGGGKNFKIFKIFKNLFSLNFTWNDQKYRFKHIWDRMNARGPLGGRWG